MKLYKSFLLKATYAIASIRRILINNLVPNVYIDKGTIIEAGVELRSQYGGIFLLAQMYNMQRSSINNSWG